jgi:hypothetical protein
MDGERKSTSRPFFRFLGEDCNRQTLYLVTKVRITILFVPPAVTLYDEG